METTSQLFSDNIKTEIIINKIKTGQHRDILNKLCYIKENALILDYIYFKHFAHNATYNFILNYITNHIDFILTNNSEFIVYVNMKNLTILDIDKHKTFIQNISIYLKDKYPQKLSKCYVHNAPFIFSQFLNFVSLFIDKDTQNKIQLI